MLAYVLAAIIALCSFALYMAAFFLPTVHRRDDFVWSGLGLFYALMLWVCAGQIRGGVLLGQMASTGLIVWFIWETVTLRRLLILKAQDTVITPELEAKFKRFSPIKFFQSFSMGKKVAPIAARPEPTERSTPETTTNAELEQSTQSTPENSELNDGTPAPSSRNVETTSPPPSTINAPKVVAQEAQEQRLKPEPAPPTPGEKAPRVSSSASEKPQPTTDPEAEDDALDGLVEVLEESLEKTASFEPPPIKSNPLKGLLAKVTGLFAKKSLKTPPMPAIEEEDDDPFDFEEEVPPPVAAEDQLPPPELQEAEGGSLNEQTVTPEDNDGAVALDQPEVPSPEAEESPVTTEIAENEPDPITGVQSAESVKENYPNLKEEDTLDSNTQVSLDGTSQEPIQELGSTDEINALLSPKPFPQPKIQDPKAETTIADTGETAEANPGTTEDQEVNDVPPSSSPADEEQSTTEAPSAPVIKKVNSPYDSLS
ncbi:MAG: hypothetical protein HC796_04310 [Synechococcaceae cyanobacterium RL_1_2]|nr:hypothetical protein [Synechococcaceae cyanobacterium RL_1_2]